MMWVLFGIGAVTAVGTGITVMGAIWAGATAGGSNLAVNVTISGIVLVLISAVVGALALLVGSAVELLS